MKLHRIFVAGALMAVGLLASPSEAVTLTLNGGTSFLTNDAAFSGLKSPGLLLGAEMTYGLDDVFEVGGFLDYNRMTGKDQLPSASMIFFGAIARVGLPLTGFFVDGRIGLDKFSYASGSSELALGFGAGLGYSISMGPLLAIKPHVGYRYLPAKKSGITVDGNAIDTSILVSFGF